MSMRANFQLSILRLDEDSGSDTEPNLEPSRIKLLLYDVCKSKIVYFNHNL